MKSFKFYIYLALLNATILAGCKKEWLDAKPSKSLVVPSTVADYQALLDDNAIMNANAPGLNVVSDDNYRVTDAVFNGLSETERNAYIWGKTDGFYGGDENSDWINTYARILYSNVVLDGIEALSSEERNLPASASIKGQALYFRSLDFYNLVQEFCKPLNASTASSDLGLPLRLSSNINLNVQRSSLQETYDQLLGDLTKAIPLLPVNQSFPTRPSKAAAYGLLSRIYLSREDYGKALLYADSCLQLQNTLMDFNTLSKSATNPIGRFNNEVVFHYTIAGYLAFRTNRLILDEQLYQSYEANDLRKSLYFITVAGNISYKGSYNGNIALFGGVATDEMYLNRAEGYARTGNIQKAMDDLNTLLKSRWQKGTYTDKAAANADEALSLILIERRKELCFRGLRWTDLRRLNKDTRFQKNITRTIAGQNYTLEPNSLRYVLPLGNNEITIGGLQQNQR